MLETMESNLLRTSPQTEDPYAKQIVRFFQTEFPANAVTSKQDLLEILTSVFIGTNNTRYGPSPNPESQVAIREVLRYNIAFGTPIPVLVPWGGRKTRYDRSIDVAEVAALKQLSCLQAMVTKYYPPGLEINIRLEDTGANYLYRSDGEVGRAATEQYSSDFQKLVRVLNLHFIHPIRESSLMNEEKYTTLANEIVEPMYSYLVESDAVGMREDSIYFSRLKAFGWKGEIPVEQRDYYRRRYIAHDPDIKPAAATQKLAEYFAGSLARYTLEGTCVSPSWGGRYIQISFVSPVPGAPTSLVSRNLYYRTVQEKMSRTHMPAWRAIGYFRIGNDRIIPGLASFNQKLDLIPQSTILSRAGEDVTVRTDYLLEE